MSEIVGLPDGAASLAADGIAPMPNASLAKARLVRDLEERLLKWLPAAKLPTLGQLVLRGALEEGQMFTHFGTVVCKGAPKALGEYGVGKPVSAVPSLRIKLDNLQTGLKVTMPIHPANYTSVSAGVYLQGTKRMFVLARLVAVNTFECDAQAYAIGFPNNEPTAGTYLSDPLQALPNHMEINFTQIDCFSGAGDVHTPTTAECARLRDISESQIKAAFADILGEVFIQKDWGGETSDLTTSHLSIGGEVFVAAFAFKGPAKFHPLTPAHLGKNGDQIVRLFHEPANLVVLQHCHKVEQSVRAQMRAFATSTFSARLFCIIDGADTVRILKAKNLLGYER